MMWKITGDWTLSLSLSLYLCLSLVEKRNRTLKTVFHTRIFVMIHFLPRLFISFNCFLSFWYYIVIACIFRVLRDYKQHNSSKVILRKICTFLCTWIKIIHASLIMVFLISMPFNIVYNTILIYNKSWSLNIIKKKDFRYLKFHIHI